MSDEKEKVLWEDNPFWLNYFIHVIILIIIDLAGIITGFVVGQYVDQLIGLILLITFAIVLFVLLGWLLVQYFKWKSIHYIIKQDEIIFEKGIIAKNILTIMVDKIEFYKLKRSLIDRFWGTGDILIYTGEEESEAEAVLNDIDNVKKVEEILKTVLSA
jgi:uncharacterized membrane protein YdbT with pleckstrin-like domain